MDDAVGSVGRFLRRPVASIVVRLGCKRRRVNREIQDMAFASAHKVGTRSDLNEQTLRVRDDESHLRDATRVSLVDTTAAAALLCPHPMFWVLLLC